MGSRQRATLSGTSFGVPANLVDSIFELTSDALLLSSFYIGGKTQPAPTATSCVAGYFYAVKHNAAELSKRSLELLGMFELVDATTAIKASTEVETQFRASYYLVSLVL